MSTRLFNKKIDQLNEELINKMLEKYDVTRSYVLIHDIIDGKPWFEYYTMTNEEFEVFKAWAIETIRKRMRWTRALAEYSFGYFNLMYGLKIEKEEYTTTKDA